MLYGFSTPIILGLITEQYGLLYSMGVSVPEFTTVGFIIECVILGYAIQKYKLIPLTPVTAAENIIETMSDSLFLIDFSGKINTVNRAASGLLGYKEEELINKPIEFVLAADTSAQIKNRFQEESSLHASFYVSETTLFTKMSENIPISLSCSLIMDKQNKTVGIVCLARDLREHKQKELEIEQSENRFTTLVESAPIGIYYSDLYGKFLYGNKRAEELVGYDKKELIGKNFLKLKLLDRRDIRKAAKLLALNRLGKKTGPDEFLLSNKNGEKIPVEIHTTLTHLGGKKVVLGMVQDITQRKKAEQKKKEEIEKFKALAEQSPNIIFIFKNGRIVYSNNSFFEILGIPPKKTRPSGFDIKSAFAQESGKQLSDMLTGLLDGEESPPREFTLNTRDGRRIEALISTTHLKYEGEDAILGVITDITAQKKREEEISESRKELQMLISHLHSVREEERTLIANEIHDEIAQALTALKMDLYGLEKEIPNEVRQASARICVMKDLLDNTIKSTRRMFSELKPYLLEHFSLKEAIEDYISRYVDQAGIESKLEINYIGIELNIERSTALYRIFQEALTNVKWHSGATSVAIGLGRRGNYLEMKIKDNGKGIPEEKITDSKSYGIIGMRERARFLKGEFEIKGAANRGTTVKVTIPVLEQQIPQLSRK